jgi:hypothetical protein
METVNTESAKITTAVPDFEYFAFRRFPEFDLMFILDHGQRAFKSFSCSKTKERAKEKGDLQKSLIRVHRFVVIKAVLAKEQAGDTAAIPYCS